MKKVSKSLSVMALCILIIAMSAVSAFAVDTAASDASNVSVEDHSVIDCTNRYKMDNGKFNFTVKLPAGTDTYDVQVDVTSDYTGTSLFYTKLLYFIGGTWDSSLTLKYSYDGSDYYELILPKFSNAGVGIKLYYRYNGTLYRATDITNGSPTEGPGYWLSA